MPASLRARNDVDYKAPVGGTGTPAWLKAENKSLSQHDDNHSPKPKPRVLHRSIEQPAAERLRQNGQTKASPNKQRSESTKAAAEKQRGQNKGTHASSEEGRAGATKKLKANAAAAAPSSGGDAGASKQQGKQIAHRGSQKPAGAASGQQATEPENQAKAPKADAPAAPAGGAGKGGSRKRKAPNSGTAAEARPGMAPGAAGAAEPAAGPAKRPKKAPSGAKFVTAPPAAAPAVQGVPAGRAKAGAARAGKGQAVRRGGGKGGEQQDADEDAALVVPEGNDYANLMRRYRRLLEMYGALKNDKISQLEEVLEEQDKGLLAAAEEAKRSEQKWKREARAQQQAAAGVQAEETRQRMKAMQDELIAAKAMVHEAEKALRLKEIEVLERDRRVAALELQREAAAQRAAARAAALAAAQAAQERARAPPAAAAAGASPVPAGTQFPTPPAPCPGAGVQVPIPLAAAAGAGVGAGVGAGGNGEGSLGGVGSPVEGLVSDVRGEEAAGRGHLLTPPALRHTVAEAIGGGARVRGACTPVVGVHNGLRAPANTPAAALTPVPRFAAGVPAAGAAAAPPPAGSAIAHRRLARTPPGGGGGAGGFTFSGVAGARLARTPPGAARDWGAATGGRQQQWAASPAGVASRFRGTPASPARSSATAALVPLRYLFGLEVREPPEDQKGVLYTHRATGFVFRLGPVTLAASPSRSAEGAGADDDVSAGPAASAWTQRSERCEEEEVAFEPLELGAAAACLPDFLKEPITFAASCKEQLVKIIFDSLANAKKATNGAGRGPGARGKAAEPGGEAAAATAEAAAEGGKGRLSSSPAAGTGKENSPRLAA